MGLKMKLPNYVRNDNLEERLSSNSKWTLEQKYLKRDNEGSIIQGPKERLYTISKTIADIDSQYGNSEKDIEKVAKTFYGSMTNLDFLPAGRVFTNTGTDTKALFNCYVLDPEDSIDPDDELNDIFGEVRKGARIHKEGGGTGYNFSKLRPRGSYVQKSKGVASGPISFMEQFDKATEIINSGNRRGANMGILDVNHPDIMDFIYAKAVHGKLKNFNISVGATDAFMDAALNGGYFPLQFNGKSLTLDDLISYQTNIEENKLAGSEVGKAPNPPSIVVDKEGSRVLDTFTNKEIGRIKIWTNCWKIKI